MAQSSPRWLRYSTSITQKRPVPTRVRLSALTDFSTWTAVTVSPGRMGS
jgi:hypothetical protein